MRRFMLNAAGTFTWLELEKGLEERKKREKQLQVVSHNARQRLEVLNKLLQDKRISPLEFEKRFLALKKEIVETGEKVTFGITGREKFLQENGCVKINNQVIQTVKDLNMKIVEFGAGAGHWAKTLSDNGVDIIAYDNMSAVPTQKMVFDVKIGDVSTLKHHQNRALMLVYPPQDDMATLALKTYNGEVVIYCGEGRGGANANSEFFDNLEKNYKVEALVTSFETFGDLSFERLWVMRKMSKQQM